MTETTDSPSLLRKAAAGTGWIIGWRMATRLMGLVSTLVLVRLLAPADFGLVALATSFAQSIEAMANLGVEDAVVREKSPTRALYDTGFTMYLITCAATAAIILALAIPAGDFFSEPRMAWVLAALALSTLLDGFINIGTVEFRRDLAFDKEVQLWLLPRLTGIVLAIASAFVLHSYWALIIGILSQRILRVVFSYRMHPFRPRLSLAEWRRLTGYSLWSWLISVVSLLRERSDSILIGRMLDTTHVGVYSVGAEVAALPTTELVEPLCRAAFSAFSAERHANASPAQSYLRIIATMAALTLPAGIGISLVAGPLVRLAFGPLWDEAVLPMQILAISGTVSVFGHVGSTLFYAHGLLRHSLRINLAALALRVTLVIALIPAFGVAGAAAGVAIAVVLEQGAFVALTVRHFGLHAADLVRAIWRSLVATAAMAAILTLAGLGWHKASDVPPVLALLEGIALGALVYGACLLLLWLAAGRPAGAETDLLGMIRRVLRRVPTRRVSDT